MKIKQILKVGLLSITYLVVFCGFALFLFMYKYSDKKKEDSSFDIGFKGDYEITINNQNLNLIPTESNEYEFEIKCLDEGIYSISLEFVETTNGGISPFINVRVKYGDRTTEKKLIDLFENKESIVFDETLNNDDVRKIQIEYIMPADVGNEAQETFSDFDLTLYIDKK